MRHMPAKYSTSSPTDLSTNRVCEFAFPGPLRDRLVAGVLSGEKTATSSLLAEWQLDGEPLPVAGERQDVVDSDGRTVATIELMAVEVVGLGDVDDRVARAEGEEYSTAAEWRREHERFWREEVFPSLPPRQRAVLDEDSPVVIQWFRLDPSASPWVG